MTKWVVMRYVWLSIALSYFARALGVPGFLAAKVPGLMFAKEIGDWAEANL